MSTTQAATRPAAGHAAADSLVEYGSRRVIITLTAIFCALLEIVDSTIVNVALNDMKGNLGATLEDVGWVITSYAIGNVIIVPMTSWLSAQFGRRNYFGVSVIIFTVCSFLCGQATGIWELVFFRFLQGLGGGALLVTSQTIITESYPPEKRGMAQAFYGLGVIIGPTLGPPLGGYITTNFSWPYIFYINIPIGIIAAALVFEFVRSPKYSEKRSGRDIDFIGIILLALFVGSLQYVLERGHQDDWFESPLIIELTALSVISFVLFIWRELTAAHPIVELRVLKDRNLSIGTALSFVLGFGLYGSTFIIPLFTQSILNWTPLQAGTLMIPAAIATAFLMPMVGQLLTRGAKPQLLVSFGMALFAVFCFWSFSKLSPTTSKDDFFWPLIVRGVGMGMLFIPITALSLSSLRGQQIGQGAAFTGMMRQLGGSFGIAVITTLIAQQNTTHYVDMIGNVRADNPAYIAKFNAMKGAFTARGMAPNIAENSAIQAIGGSVMKQAAILSYMDIFLWLGVMFLIFVPMMLFVRQRKGSGPSREEMMSAH
jgi:DHA2 family multidrug resistance protein